MKRQQGFTLIELMIVIAILGILMAIAIPAYQDYLVRARASESLLAMAPAKLGVSEFVETNGRWPGTSLASVGLTFVSTSYVSTVTIGSNGVVNAQAQATNCSGGEPLFTMTPTTSASAVKWKCTTSKPTCAPASCRS